MFHLWSSAVPSWASSLLQDSSLCCLSVLLQWFSSPHSSFPSSSRLPLLLPLPLPRRLERLRLRRSSAWMEVSRSLKTESSRFGCGSSATFEPVCSETSGMDGGGASETPLVIHEGIVVPRPRPAGPAAWDGASVADAPGRAAGAASPSEAPFVIQEGSVEPLPRPAGPRTGEGSFSLALDSLALFGFGSPSPAPCFDSSNSPSAPPCSAPLPSASSSSSSSSLSSSSSYSFPSAPGGFQFTSMVLAPVLPATSSS
mmetsp:Transcript_111272/g.359205  ORF Transcript_111272/g.359205 Transcript_111272/m.359205 type:complete len:256 (+) Transcript_111272:743-1510(+)